MSKVMSERQQYWHGHLRRADEQQVSLAQYAREQGLKLTQLYGAKTWLVKLGVWPRGAQRSAAPASEFVAVHLPPPGSRSARCRLSHVSGWSMECECWPDVVWLRNLVGRDAAA
jgi:hypothetical protein